MCSVTSVRLGRVSRVRSLTAHVFEQQNEGLEPAAGDLRGGIRCRRVIHLRICLGFGAESAVAMQE